MTADRFDQGKAQLHYNDTFPVAEEGVARVSEYGANKYSAYNYMRGAKGSIESYNCARRHMLKWLNGVDFDAEAKEKGFELHHIDLAIWNLKRLRQELHDFPDRDNRPCKVLAANDNDSK